MLESSKTDKLYLQTAPTPGLYFVVNKRNRCYYCTKIKNEISSKNIRLKNGKYCLSLFNCDKLFSVCITNQAESRAFC